MHSLAALLGPSALATKEFTIDPAGTDERYVRIVGRKSGIIDWVLTLLGIDTTTVFEVYGDHIRFKASSLSGSTTTVLPLTAISSTTSGFFKPILYLVVALGLFLFGLVTLIPSAGLGLVLVLLSVIPLVYYFLHKALMIGAQSHSGAMAAIAFKRSLIEGVKVTQEDADQVIDIINQLTLRQQAR